MSNSPFCTSRVRTCLGRCVLGILVVWIGCAAFGQKLPDDHAADEPPHPWIASAPPAFARLIDKGEVRIVTDDERLQASGKRALTLFYFHADHQHRFQLTRVRPSPSDPSQTVGDIVAQIRSLRLATRHTIVLEQRFQPENPWATALLHHEFDHVSISTDPRFLKIGKQLLQKPIRCSVTWANQDGLAADAIDAAIKGEMSARISALERLVQTNYDALDRESRDGQANLGERFRFFEELYSMAWLRKCEFPYLDSIRVAAQDSANKEVLEHYLPVD